jgi:diguanylate cyclase (GGDEF)-like protein
MVDARTPRTLARLLERLGGARPAPVWTAALLSLYLGLSCFASLVFPISPVEPRRLVLMLGVAAIAAGVSLWTFGRRVSMTMMQPLLALASALISLTVANARTSGGAALCAFAYPWIIVYVAHFSSRRAIFAQSLLISVGFGAALVRSGLPNMTIDWMTVTVTVWSTGFVLGNLTEGLRRRAETDPLTGLLNRNGFLTVAARERAVAERTRAPLTVAVLDLDGFKQVNDRFGHAAGDRVLADLAARWRDRLRAGDILARHGGDEFVLLLPATTAEGAAAVLDRLQVDGASVQWSVGVSEWLPAESLDACLARADRGLYGAKESHGRLAPVVVGGLRAGVLLPST